MTAVPDVLQACRTQTEWRVDWRGVLYLQYGRAERHPLQAARLALRGAANFRVGKCCHRERASVHGDSDDEEVEEARCVDCSFPLREGQEKVRCRVLNCGAKLHRSCVRPHFRQSHPRAGVPDQYLPDVRPSLRVLAIANQSQCRFWPEASVADVQSMSWTC